MAKVSRAGGGGNNSSSTSSSNLPMFREDDRQSARVRDLLESLQSNVDDPEMQLQLLELKRALLDSKKDWRPKSSEKKKRIDPGGALSLGDEADSSAGLGLSAPKPAASRGSRAAPRHLHSTDGLCAVEDSDEQDTASGGGRSGSVNDLGRSRKVSVPMRYDAGPPHGVGDYLGDVVDGVPHGEGTMEWPSGKRYRGTWRKGKRDGKGLHVWTDGRSFEGQWMDGKPHGLGNWTSPRGEAYSGELIRGKKSGKGTFTYPDGKTYTGDWLDGLRHGEGTRAYPDGSTYVGSWVNDKRHGQGKYTWKDGRVWSGQWREGNPTKDAPRQSGSGHHRINSEGLGTHGGSELDLSRSEISNRSSDLSQQQQQQQQQQQLHHGRKDSVRSTEGFPPTAREPRSKAAAAAMREMRELREFSIAADRLKKPIVLAEGDGEDAIERQGTSSTIEGTTTGSDWGGLSGPEGDTSGGGGSGGGNSRRLEGDEGRRETKPNERQQHELREHRQRQQDQQQQQQQQQRQEQQVQQQTEQQAPKREQPIKSKGIFGGAAEIIGQWGPSRVLSSVARRRSSENASSESHEPNRSRSDHSREGSEDRSDFVAPAQSGGEHKTGAPVVGAPDKPTERPSRLRNERGNPTQVVETSLSPAPSSASRRSTASRSQQQQQQRRRRGHSPLSVSGTPAGGHESARDGSRRRQQEDRAMGGAGDDYGVGGTPFVVDRAPIDGSGSRTRSSRSRRDSAGSRVSRDRHSLVERADEASRGHRRGRSGEASSPGRQGGGSTRKNGVFDMALFPPPPTAGAPAPPIAANDGRRGREGYGEREPRQRSRRESGSSARSSGGGSSRRSSSRGPSSRNRPNDEFEEYYSMARESMSRSGRIERGSGGVGSGREVRRESSTRQKMGRSRSLKGDSSSGDRRRDEYDDEEELSDFDESERLYPATREPDRERSKNRSSTSRGGSRGSGGTHHQRRKSDGEAISREFRRQQQLLQQQQQQQQQQQKQQQQKQQQENRERPVSRPSPCRTPIPELKFPIYKSAAASEGIRELRERSQTSSSRNTPAGNSAGGERQSSREKPADTSVQGSSKSVPRSSGSEAGSQGREHQRSSSSRSRGRERRTSTGDDKPPMVEVEYNTGVPHGTGEYVGQIKDGRPDGQGTIVWPSGKRYTGSWQHGNRHGYGTFSWDDGRVHQCEWANNKAHGQGTFWYGDGTSYAGDWVEGLKHGHGVRTYPGGVMYDGQWRYGTREGKAVWCGPDGMYEGEYFNDAKHGQGTYTWSDGRKYTGGWQDGKQHGQGVLYAKDGKITLRGKWKKGEKTLFF